MTEKEDDTPLLEKEEIFGVVDDLQTIMGLVADEIKARDDFDDIKDGHLVDNIRTLERGVSEAEEFLEKYNTHRVVDERAVRELRERMECYKCNFNDCDGNHAYFLPNADKNIIDIFGEEEK